MGLEHKDRRTTEELVARYRLWIVSKVEMNWQLWRKPTLYHALKKRYRTRFKARGLNFRQVLESWPEIRVIHPWAVKTESIVMPRVAFESFNTFDRNAFEVFGNVERKLWVNKERGLWKS